MVILHFGYALRDLFRRLLCFIGHVFLDNGGSSFITVAISEIFCSLFFMMKQLHYFIFMLYYFFCNDCLQLKSF